MATEVVNQQPLAGDWMVPVFSTEAVTRGLHWLRDLDNIVAHLQTEWIDGGVFDGYEKNKRFVMRNQQGKFIYYSVEDSSCVIRYCLGSWRPFGMKVVNNINIEVIHLTRPFRCDYCCFPCCMQVMEVSSPQPFSHKYGSVVQVWNFLMPKFKVLNAEGELVFWIKGPVIVATGQCNQPVFKILSVDEMEQMGKITMDFNDLVKPVEDSTWFSFREDVNRFGICFPLNLDVRMKAVLIGALFLIDFMYFESNDTDTF